MGEMRSITAGVAKGTCKQTVTTKEIQTMRKKRFTQAQITHVLGQATAGVPVVKLARRYGISPGTFYAWRKKYGGRDALRARKLKQLDDENRRLKAMVADLTLDKQILQDVLVTKR